MYQYLNLKKLAQAIILIVISGMSFNLNAAEKNHAPKTQLAGIPPELLDLMTPQMIFNYFAAAFNGQRVSSADNSTKINITDLGENYLVEIKHKIIHLYANKNVKADVDVSMNKHTAAALILGQMTPRTAIRNGSVKMSGDKDKVQQLRALLRA